MSRMVPISLPGLRSHSIFLPSSSSPTEDDWEVVDPPSDPPTGRKTSQLVMWDKDLLVAIGSELRMTSLSGGEGWEVKGGVIGSYKVLKSTHLSFPIQQLVLNPTGRLLAAIGLHQVAVIVLPKSRFVGTSGGELNCRSFAIDEFRFSLSSSVDITKVIWNPMAESGNSLWILTSDGKLREYDILHPLDPTQTFTFLPSGPSSSRFTAADPLSRYAISFAFGIGKYDFGPLMVHVLMANGDIYTMGPVLPLHAEMPLRYLQGLKAYSDNRLRRVREESGNDDAEESAARIGRATLQAQWVESLVKQVQRGHEYRRRREEDEFATPSRRTSSLSERYPRRAWEVNANLQRPPLADGMVRLHPPHLSETGGPAPGVHRAVVRQGPRVFSPRPQDIGIGSEEDGQIANDLWISHVEARPEENRDLDGGEGVTLVAIAWSGGRVDLGIETEKPEPRWLSSRDQSSSSPTLSIIESILLRLPAQDPSDVAANAPTFAMDPLHSDVIYVQHSFGIDAICINPWVDDMAGDEDLPPSEVTRLVESAGSPPKPIVGVVTFCNITLGYGLLALASSHQLAAIELDFRMTESATDQPASPELSLKEPSAEDERDAYSLLLAKPVDFPELISSIRQPGNYDPRDLIRKLPEYKKPLQTVSPDHLRVLGEITSQVQARTRAIRAASQAIENRIDLEVQELQRQLKLLKDCSTRITQLRKSTTRERTERMLDTQGVLGERLDKVSVAMWEEYRPQIGEAERKWFDELDRLKSRVRGGGNQHGKGLAGREQLVGQGPSLRYCQLMTREKLQEQLAAIKPVVKSLRNPDEESDGVNGEYGSKQIRPLEIALSARSDEIRKLLRRMETLTFRVDAAGVEENEGDAER